MARFSDFYSAEDVIQHFLHRDFIGPVNEGEVLFDAPLELYAMGILYPASTVQADVAQADAEPQADVADAEVRADAEAIEDVEDSLGGMDGQMNAANMFRPSAMAITAVAPLDAKAINIRFSCGMYTHREVELSIPEKVVDADGVEQEISKRRIENEYTHHPIDSGTLTFPLIGRGPTNAPNIPSNIEIRLFMRKEFSNGAKLFTVSVTNLTKAQNRAVVQNTTALFHCKLELDCLEGFLPIRELHKRISGDETEDLDMLYRDAHNYAVGHGCSASWADGSAAVYHIESSFMPIAELRQMAAAEFPELQCFSMEFLRTSDCAVACDEMDKFITKYTEWREIESRYAGTLGKHSIAVTRAIDRIDECIMRMKAGVQILRTNKSAWQSFCYMNEAMQLQRVNYAKTRGKTIDPLRIVWYPFQLAYILQIIPDIENPASRWRETVDLLWFPTGGGKTEAYLGLASFIIFYRRITKEALGAGVTIIMRYTLRLLTAQQFERASALICACEYIRRRDRLPGGEISIGLWVGLDVTPNTLDAATKILTKIKEGEYVRRENPVQIFHCPFCGASISAHNYSVTDTLNIRCPNAACEYHRRLPVYIVDQDIYKALPTLLISTIDKFARIAWEPNTAGLFGIDGDALPPELIIQDELHLISGPLGSISGLYEAAVDELCTKGGIRPKIIASTATVRNAAQQIKSLYNRRHFQFPPSGIDIDNSFFAIRDKEEKRPKRRYLGICETGGSILDSLIRVYGTVLFSLNYLRALGVTDEVIDQYWTIVGYFNALKDLGSAATAIIDRVKTYSESLLRRKFKEDAEKAGISEIFIHSSDELTSRKSSAEIKDTLEALEMKFPDERAYSYILASNMLSVGIDIDRLGLMTVYAQPKTNAEYIQATSRVGRSNPGMVITLYHATRTRDKSHYEQFGHYHRTFYRYVEPTSVTPFSARAIEKALHSIYVALIRLKIPRWRKQANLYRKEDPEATAIRDYLIRRVQAIAPQAEYYAQELLDEFECAWERNAIEKSDSLLYTLREQSTNAVPLFLLVSPDVENPGFFPPTINSLRNVDAEANVFIRRRMVARDAE